MSSENYYIGVDEFSTTIAKILEDVNTKVAANEEEAVKAACRFGRKACKDEASGLDISDRAGVDTWEKYKSGFASTVKRNNEEVLGEIGNKKVPGLTHLIEKGHAIMGDGTRRARAFPHISTAAKETFVKFEEDIMKAVDRAL